MIIKHLGAFTPEPQFTGGTFDILLTIQDGAVKADVKGRF